MVIIKKLLRLWVERVKVFDKILSQKEKRKKMGRSLQGQPVLAKLAQIDDYTDEPKPLNAVNWHRMIIK